MIQAFEKQIFPNRNMKKDREEPAIRKANGPIRSVSVRTLGFVDDPAL